MSIDYTPALHVTDYLGHIDFVAVVGPTAVGKTTLIKAAAAADSSLHMLVSCVSRAQRPGEQDGVDFHFSDKAAMEARVQKREYVTVVEGVSGDLYATAPEDYPKNKTVIMATLADAVSMFRALPYRAFKTIFIVPPSWEVWQERLQSHPFTSEQREQRLAEARRSLRFALDDPETRFLINNDLPKAIEGFLLLASGKSLPPNLRAEQETARVVVRTLLQKLA